MHGSTKRAISAIVTGVILTLAWVLLPILLPWQTIATHTAKAAPDPAKLARPRLSSFITPHIYASPQLAARVTAGSNDHAPNAIAVYSASAAAAPGSDLITVTVTDP